MPSPLSVTCPQTQSLRRPATRSCGASADETCRECTGLIMPRHLHTWRVHAYGCYKFDKAEIGYGPRDRTAHFPAFLHLRVTKLPGPVSTVRKRSRTTATHGQGVGKQERKRLRKRLGQQAPSSTATSPNMPTTADRHHAAFCQWENIARSLLLGRPLAPCPCVRPLLRCDPTHSASTSEI